MELKHIDLADLSVSSANMRIRGRAPDLTNILPSVRVRGVLVPLIVRAVGEAGGPDTGSPRYEIVAGKRRFYAAMAIAEESGEAEPLPCAVIAAGDDAAALEASLIENVARLDPDEVTRWESFTRLVREGRDPQAIALTFGLTELQVKRTLALGNLLPRIRNLYRRGEIDAATVRHLTLASKTRQRDWLALLDDESVYCPTGSQLKAWLFGGASIPVAVALFDLDTYAGEIVSDLFGEERYFADTASFWTAQTAAIKARAEGFREAGWSEVVVLGAGEYFHSWEYEKRSRAKGGKVIIDVGHGGDVTIHEGVVTLKEARRQCQPDVTDKPKRPELTTKLTNYIDLHRHAAVRARVASEPDIAIRLMLAHAIVGSGLWNVRVEPQRAASDAIAESVETCASETMFDERRRSVLTTLGFDAETSNVTGGYDGENGISGLFFALLALSNEAVMEALAVVMAETLDAGTALIETVGRHLAIDMADLFAVDQAMLDLIKDRETLDALVAETAGQVAADANAKATGKVKRQIVADSFAGSNGRARVERFVPRWMTFPPSAYTARGGVETVSRAAAIEPLFQAISEAEMPADGAAEQSSVASVPAADEALEQSQDAPEPAADTPLAEAA
ncbi:MAG: ParB/RepB/Spo0J family partition protein [Pseudomonadota bacterium]